MKLVILIPSYNEEDTIGKVISNIPHSITGMDEIVTLVINDGSQDKTTRIAKDSGAMVVSHSQNQGVGIAFQTGLSTALKMEADIMVNIDADCH